MGVLGGLASCKTPGPPAYFNPCCTATCCIDPRVSSSAVHPRTSKLEKTMMTAEQIVASHKANVETLFGLTATAFEGVEKLVELNMTAAKAALSESAQNTQSALSVKDAQELLALQANLFQPLAEKAAVYSRQLYDIASGTGGDFTKAFEAQAALAQKQFASLLDTATSNAPAGSESAVDMMKGTVAAANNAFESVQKAVKQASDLAESNFNAMAQNVSGVAPAAKSSKKR